MGSSFPGYKAKIERNVDLIGQWITARKQEQVVNLLIG